MDGLVIGNFYLFIVLAFIQVFRGLDWKRWTSWLWALYGFVTGFFVGRAFISLIGAFELGAFMGFIVMYGGIVRRWYRERDQGDYN